MAFGLMDVFVKIGADTSELNSGLESAEGSVNNFTSALGGVAKFGLGAMATLGTTIAGSSAAFVNAAGDVASYGDNIDKMSQKMGISAEGYQEWEAVMQHSGTSMETMKASMKTLANAVEGGNDAFERIGISLEDLSTMSNEDIFNATIAGLQQVDNETERTYLAGQLLGKGATELGALLNTSAEDTQAMKDRVHELGGVMSDEAVKAAAQYQDSLQDMQTAFDGLKRGIVSEFLPSITTVMDGLANLFSGDSKGLGQIQEGISSFVDNLSAALPKVIETGTKIINSLLQAITENAPQLVKAGVDAIINFVQGIISNGGAIVDSAVQIVDELVVGITQALPVLAEGAIQIIVGLANGLAEMLPNLIPAVVQMVMQIVQTLVDNIPLLLDAAIQLIQGLADGLLAALPVLIDMLPSIIQSIVDAIVTGLPKLIDGLIKLINGIVTALPTIIQSLINALPLIIDSLIKGLMAALPALIQGAIQLTMAIVKALPTIIKALVAAIPQIIGLVLDAVINNMPLIIQGLIEANLLLVAALPEIIMALIEAIPELVTSIAQAILMSASLIYDAVVQILDQVGQTLGQKGTEFVSNVGQSMSDMFNTVVEWLSQLPGKMAYWAGYAIVSFMKFIQELPGKIKTEFDNVMTKLKEFATNFIDKAKETSREFLDKLLEKIKEAPGKLAELGTSMIDTLKDLPEKFKQLGRDIIQGLINGFLELKDKVVTTLTNIVNAGHKGAKDAAESQSPSKKFMRLGRDIDRGLIIGMEELVPEVRKTTQSLVEAVQIPDQALGFNLIGSADDINKGIATASVYNDESLIVSDMVDAFVKALDRYGLTVEVDNRELGRVVRREVLA